MKKLLFVTTILGGLATAFAANAQMDMSVSAPPAGLGAGALLVHLNALGVLPGDSSSSIAAVGGRVNASDAVIPELDISYFLTDNIAVAAIAGSSEHTITASGTAVGSHNVGTVWALPPTITVQWYPWPKDVFSPYLGAGVNLTWWYASSADAPFSKLTVGNSWGPAIQAGFDYNIGGRWFANLDVKYILMNVDARVDSAALGAYHVRVHDALNPVLVGAGIGYRF